MRILTELSWKQVHKMYTVYKADIHWTFEADISSENNPDQKVKLSVSK